MRTELKCPWFQLKILAANSMVIFMLLSSTSIALLPKQTLSTVGLIETCPTLPSDLEAIHECTFPLWVKSTQMKGEGWHSHCLSCFMQDSLYWDASGKAYWIELGKSHQTGKSTLWILIGLEQIFCEVKFKVVVDLSTKIKKIPRKGFFGEIFLPFNFFSQLFCCFPPQLSFPQQPIDYQPRLFFFQGGISTSCHRKGRDVSCNLTQWVPH